MEMPARHTIPVFWDDASGVVHAKRDTKVRRRKPRPSSSMSKDHHKIMTFKMMEERSRQSSILFPKTAGVYGEPIWNPMRWVYLRISRSWLQTGVAMIGRTALPGTTSSTGPKGPLKRVCKIWHVQVHSFVDVCEGRSTTYKSSPPANQMKELFRLSWSLGPILISKMTY
eukprot:2887263-Amphidinium_carterae.1